MNLNRIFRNGAVLPLYSLAVLPAAAAPKAAEELYPTWQKNIEQWKVTGGDHGYHYLGSAIWFNRIGQAMGEAMKELTVNK
jgi:hypothetical protein